MSRQAIRSPSREAATRMISPIFVVSFRVLSNGVLHGIEWHILL